MLKKPKDWWPVGWLTGVWFVSFTPLLFFRRWIHWDLVAYTLPQLIFQSDFFRGGQLPLWNPFQDCGLPVFSNPVSHLWYPLNHLIIWTAGYSIQALQYELLFHYLFAGFTSYVLARRFGLSPSSAAFSATSYMLSGIFIGHAEHMDIVVSFVWLPLMLAGALGWFNNQSKRNLWMTGIALLFMLLGGLPASNLMGLFFFAIFVMLRLREKIAGQGFGKALREYLSPLAMACLIPLLVSAFYLFPSLVDMASYSGSGAAVSYEKAIASNALPIWALVSIVLPVSHFLRSLQVFDAESSISMLNCYFGIVSLCLALFAISTRRSRSVLELAALGVLGLLIALGGRLAFRGLLYELVPFFSMFRHPAVFRGFFILFFALLAGFGMEELCRNQSGAVLLRRALLLFIFLLGIILGFAAVAALAIVRLDQDSAQVLRYAFLESIPLQIILLLGLYFWLKSNPRRWPAGILLLAGIDLSSMVHTNIDVVGSFLKPKDRVELLVMVPRRKRSDFEYRPLGMADHWGILQNMGMVYKEFHLGAYCPFRSADLLKVMDTGFHKVAAKFPRFFLVPAVEVHFDRDSSLEIFARASEEDRMPVVVNAEPPGEIASVSDASYSLNQVYPQSLRVLNYSLNHIELEFANNRPALLAGTEGFHPGWKATLDGKRVPTVKVNFAFRGVYVLKPGMHRLVWEFKPESFKQGLWVSGAGLLLLCGWMAATVWNRKQRP